MRSGYGCSLFEPLLPLILGHDVSGEVAAIGAFEVFGALHPTAVWGTYTDYAILSEDELTAKLVSISREASAIPFAALTAWRALKSTARITQGQRVLVVSGEGAVSFATIQLALAVEYHDIESTLKGKFDAVLDTIGVLETERTSINFFRRGGHYMTLQGETVSLIERYELAIGLPIVSAIFLKKQIQYRYSHRIGTEKPLYSVLCMHGNAFTLTLAIQDFLSWTYIRADAEGLAQIRRLSEVGKLKIPVEKTFPITQVREAHEAKDKRLIPGKVVLELD
ncbi:hypothetical protein ACSBR1_032170 [Camellia fascicularis]